MKNITDNDANERALTTELKKNWIDYLQSSNMRSSEYERRQRATLAKYQIMKDKLQEYQDLLNPIIECIEQNKPNCKSINLDEGDERIEDFVNELENIIYGS